MRGLYIGSFDMFTKGHLDILDQAANLIDDIVIAVGYNHLKKRKYTIDSSIKSIKESIETRWCSNTVTVISTDKLPVVLAQDTYCDYLIRGLRNITDYTYEENLRIFNKEIDPGIKTVYFFANYPYISSTAVKELINNGIDVTSYLPYDVNILEEIK